MAASIPDADRLRDVHPSVPPNAPAPPIAMIVFNRPERAAPVFEAIRAARPRTLIAIADGPRPGRPSDAADCKKTREIFDRIDWPCELIRVFSDENLGCRRRVGSGITEAFRHVETCIILEDDCLPHPTFFPYCAELLERYADNERIMTISGNSFPSAVGGMAFPYSYFVTRFAHIWGWATWRRAWAHYDDRMTKWPALRDSGWLRTGGWFPSLHDRLYWTLWFEMCHDGRLDTWDVPWVFSSWSSPARGLSICPDRNLVSNIGFGEGATHTKTVSPLANLPALAMDFPLRHPPSVDAPDQAADAWTQRHCFTGSRKRRLKRLLRRIRSGVKARI